VDDGDEYEVRESAGRRNDICENCRVEMESYRGGRRVALGAAGQNVMLLASLPHRVPPHNLKHTNSPT
jgi:hypothetical protein